MQIQHSSRNDSWRTPADIIDRARRVLQTIDLDPASDVEANERVQARRILTVNDDGLVSPWLVDRDAAPLTIWLNPPGGKRSNKSLTALFWERLMCFRDSGHLQDAIFMAFSLEALQTTQASGPGRRMIDFAFCVPKRRIAFDHPNDTSKRAPSHSNAIIYVPSKRNRTGLFLEEFREVGGCGNVGTI